MTLLRERVAENLRNRNRTPGKPSPKWQRVLSGAQAA